METELLNEQYNSLIIEPKTKLENLREKKKLMNQQKNNDKNYKSQLIDHEIDSEMRKVDEYDQELFANLDKIDALDSSDDNEDQTVKNLGPKIIVKKNKKSDDSNKLSPNQDNMKSVRESLSYADRLREFQDENGRLRKVLAEKDYEISYLKRKLDDESSLANLGSGDAATASKIVDLAKKVRELTANLETERTKNKQLSKNCMDLEMKLDGIKSGQRNHGDENGEDQGDVDGEERRVNLVRENRELKEKLNQISHKMMEFKSQCEILKQDLKKTQKALEKEVGDNVDVKAILSGQTNWRGRQQQITNLQTKVADLKQQLGVMDMRQSQMILIDEEDEVIDELADLKDQPPKSAQPSLYSVGMNSSPGSVRTNLHSRHRNDLRHLEKEKREQLDKMKRDLEAMENDYGSIKEKLEASKARNKVLSNENKTHKDQIKTLLEKGKHDDELIEALLKKNSQMKEMIESLSQANDKTTKELEEKTVQAQVKTMQEKNTIEQMKLIISERERRVRELEEELKRVKETLYSNFNNQSGNKEVTINHESEFIKSRPMSSSRPTTGTPNTLNRADSMLEREISSTRFNLKSGGKPSSASSQAQQRPLSSSGLGKNVADQKKEHQSDLKLENCELKTLLKTSEIERMRLMELAKTQQKRLEELNEKSLESENRLNEERRRCANLEKQLEKLKLQEKDKNNRQPKTIPTGTSAIDQYKLEELETSLLIQKDENEAIKAALKSTLEAKEEDLRLYCEMLESTKKVYLDGLKSYKQIALN